MCIKFELSIPSTAELQAWTDRQTDTHTDRDRQTDRVVNKRHICTRAILASELENFEVYGHYFHWGIFFGIFQTILQQNYLRMTLSHGNTKYTIAKLTDKPSHWHCSLSSGTKKLAKYSYWHN